VVGDFSGDVSRILPPPGARDQTQSLAYGRQVLYVEQHPSLGIRAI
jgi:hypothetical protein